MPHGLRLYLVALYKADWSVSGPSSDSTDNEAFGCSAVTNLMTHSCWSRLTDGNTLADLHLKADSSQSAGWFKKKTF